MGLFGGQTKVPDQLEERYAAEEQEEMPQLPEPHTNTVIEIGRASCRERV